MYKYKVFSWNLDLSSDEDLENQLNKYADEGWKVKDIISNLKGSGNILYTSLTGTRVTFVLEKTK